MLLSITYNVLDSATFKLKFTVMTADYKMSIFRLCLFQDLEDPLLLLMLPGFFLFLMMTSPT